MLAKLKTSFKRFYWKNQFNPSWAGVFVNPFWLCRRALYRAIQFHALQFHGDVLDFGCGSKPYAVFFGTCSSYTGLEYDTLGNRARKSASLFYDGITIPLDDAAVDGVLSTQTLEHVSNPEHIVSEWARVLRPGGKLLITVPLMWPEHEMPNDFQRYTMNGIKALLGKAGFVIMGEERLLADCRAPAQLFQAWLVDVLQLSKRPLAVQVLLTTCLFMPITVFFSMLAKVTPTNTNSYVDNVILAYKCDSAQTS